jgi:phosphate transport system substrate-binding protein
MGMVTQAWASSPSLINGAGATFPFPLYSKWFSEYGKLDPQVQINYQSIGSGGGIRQFKEKTVDFGATDTPLSNDQLQKIGAPVLHIPTTLGAVVLTYNIPGIPQGMKLTGELISQIFLGKVQKWNDPALTQLNPELKSIDLPIIVTRRSDGSGTTHVFTDYLSQVSPEWKQRVGTGAAVNWPTGLGGKGNEGVTGMIKQTPGAIGYVELVYAEKNSLPYAAIQNRAKNFILPSVESIQAAAESKLKSIPEDLRISITDPDGKKSYPISSFTYLIVYQHMPQSEGAAGSKGEKLKAFLHWAMTAGQKYAPPLHYAPLPQPMIQKVETKIKTITLN